MKYTPDFDFDSLPVLDADPSGISPSTEAAPMPGADGQAAPAQNASTPDFDFDSLPILEEPVAQIQTMSPKDFKGQPNMGGATEQALMAQAQGGPVAEKDDGSISSWLKNAWNAFAHNASGRVASSDINWKTQRVMEGVAEKEGGKRVSFLDLPDAELDDYMNSIAPNGFWGYVGNAIGMGGRNDLMKEWDETQGAKIADPTERKKARVQYAMDVAKGVFQQTEEQKQFAQAELQGRGRQWQSGLTGGAIQMAGYMAPALAPVVGMPLSAAVEGTARRNELLSDKYETDADGNVFKVAQGDTRGSALVRGAIGGTVQAAVEKYAGKVAGKIISKIPGAAKAGDKVMSTAIGKAVGKFYRPFGKFFEKTGLDDAPSEFLEEFAQTAIDSTFGLDRRQSEMPDGMVSLERGLDATVDLVKNSGNLLESMLLIQLAGGGLAHMKNRLDANRILRDVVKVDPRQIKGYSTETKWRLIDNHFNGMSEEQKVKVLEAGAKEADNLLHTIEKERLDSFEGRLQTVQAHKDAAKRIYEAREQGKDVSRRMLQEMGIDTELYPTVAERNALADQFLEDRTTYRMRQEAEAAIRRTKMDEVQRGALADEITALGIDAESKEYGGIWLNVANQISDAKELDDPVRRAELVQNALEKYVKENGELNVQFTTDDGATHERSWTYNPPKKETTDETRTDEAPAQPQQGAVGTGQAEAETPRPEAVGAQSAEADGVVAPPVEPIAETPKTDPTSAPSAEGAITQPKATESAEGQISQSDGAITPEQAAAERKKGKRIPKTAVKTEGTAPVVEKSGDEATISAPQSVEDRIAAMPRGSKEQLKAQHDYVTQEIAKAKAAIEGKFTPKTGKLTPEEKQTDAYDRVKDSGDIPETVNIKVPGDGEITVKNNPHGMEYLDKFAAKFKPQTSGLASEMSIPKPPSVKIAEKPKVESAEKETKAFVSKDKEKTPFLKPYSVGDGYVYASDGRIAVRRKLRKGEKVAPNQDKRISSLSHLLFEGRTSSDYSLDTAETYPKIVQALTFTSKGWKSKGFPLVDVFRGVDGKLQFRSRDDNGNGYATDAWAKTSTFVTSCNGEQLRDVLKLAAKSGAKNIGIGIDENGISYFKFGEWEAVMMPIKVDDNTRKRWDAEDAAESAARPEASAPAVAESKQSKAAERINSIDDISDDDFSKPTRNVELPKLPKNVDEAIGANGKPVVIKQNIFEKNAAHHPELDGAASRSILKRSLYNPNLVGQSQPATKPNYRIAIQTGDRNAITILDVHQSKENIEVVGWRSINEKGFERLKRQAAREGGQFLILHPSEEGQPGALSGRPSGLTGDKVSNADQKVKAESAPKAPKAPKLTEDLKKRGIQAARILGVESGMDVPELEKTLKQVSKLDSPAAKRKAQALRDLIEYRKAVGQNTDPQNEESSGGKWRGESMKSLGSFGSPDVKSPLKGDNTERNSPKSDRSTSKVNRDEKKSPSNPLGQIVPPEDGSVAQAIDKEIALGIPPAPAPGSATNASLDSDYEPESIGKGIKSPISRQEIVDEFKRLFKDSVAIRGKNTTQIGKQFSGHYEPNSGIIRTKDYTSVSLRTIPHEIGHHIDTQLKRLALARPASVKNELARLGVKLYGAKKPNGGYESEGFAEIIKYYLQGNEAGLKKEVPNAYDWLINKFGKADPDTMAKLDDLRDLIDRLQNQSGEDAVRAIRAKDLSAGEKLVMGAKKVGAAAKPAQEHWTNVGAFIDKAMKASGLDKLTDWHSAMKSGDTAKMNEIIENDPRLKWELYTGRAGARAFQSLEGGLMDLSGTRRYTYGDLGVATPGHSADENIPTFKEIFQDFTAKEMDEFQNYAIARIAKEAYLDKDLVFGLTESEVAPVIAKHANNQKFRKALDQYTHYKHAVLHLLVDSGAMSQEQFDAIVAANPIYVKIARRRESVDFFRDKMLKSRGKAVNKRTGSGRQIEDIFAAGLVDDERIFKAAFQSDILRSLVELGKKGERAGGVKAGYTIGANWIHEVPNAQGAVKFTSEKLRKQIVDAMQKTAVATDKASAENLFDQIFDDGKDTLTIFKEKPSNGKNGVVSLYDQEGRLHTYELPENNAEGWAKGLWSFTDASAPNIIEKTFSMFAASTRSGATVLNPAFAATNFVIDTLHASVMNEYGTFFPLVSSLRGVVDKAMNSKASQIYDNMALGMGTMLGRSSLPSAKKATKYIQSKNWFIRQWNKGVIKGIADMVGYSEDGTRIAAFKNARDYMLKHGASEKAANIIAGANAGDITINFLRGGETVKRINRIVPFFNAGVQGVVQSARAFGLTDPKAWSRIQSRKGRAARTMGKGIGILMMTALLAELYNHLSDNEDEIMELKPYEKWNKLPIGNFRLPIPHVFGFLFMSLPRAVFYEVYHGDKGAVKECLGMFRKTFPWLSPRDVALLGPTLEVAMNETWSGSPIVSPHVMENRESYDWYTPRTTTFSKALAKALHTVFGNSKVASPAHIDAFLNGVTGNMYGNLLGLFDGDVGFDSSRPHTYPIVGRFFRSDATSSRLIDDFYSRRDELSRKKGSGKATDEELGKLKYANQVADELSDLRKQAESVRKNDSLSNKQKYDELEEIAKIMQNQTRQFLKSK